MTRNIQHVTVHWIVYQHRLKMSVLTGDAHPLNFLDRPGTIIIIYHTYQQTFRF